MDKSDIDRLANQFMLNTVKVKAGDNIWVEYFGPKAKVIADACAQKVKAAGGKPYMVDRGSDYTNSTIGPMLPAQIEAWGKERLEKMKPMQGYIAVCDDADEAKYALPPAQLALYKQARYDMTKHRVNNTRWLVTSAPTEEFAEKCGMSLPDFERFYLDACLVDYQSMSKAVEPLKKLMAEGKKVRILSPAQETDLTFSIEGIPAEACTGTNNLPDGECFTAPVKDSINGTVKFGPSCYKGQKFEWIKLRFENGRVMEAQAENKERTEKLVEILNDDEGSRYAGEFAINFNPFIKHPTSDILFDEKIDGGWHLALGDCYDNIPNGNKSKNHWDMVQIQRPEYGGGEIYIDDRLIRKDGIFVVPELAPLNPENLIAAASKKPAAHAR